MSTDMTNTAPRVPVNATINANASDWTGGYVADAPYRIAYQAAQTPAHLAMVCALAGVPWGLREQMQVADLGCGRGYVANTLAAANPGWGVWGLDHSPVHIAEARHTAARAALDNAHFQEADLAALSAADLHALPPLDVVMLHGVWTWVSDGVRDGIVRLLSRRLKPGGLVYVGYNALPAAGADHALQRLLCHFAGPFGQAGVGGAEAAAELAMSRLRRFAPALPLPKTPMLQRLMASPPQLQPAFVAHEFLTRHWRPVFHEDLCAALAPAKLDFVGSSNLFEALPGLYAQASQLAVMRGLPEGAAQELVKDLCLPRSFRADVFVRGARATDPSAALDELVLAACQDLPETSPPLNTGTAQARLSADVWASLCAALARQPQPLGVLRAALGPAAPHAAELLSVLVGTGQVLPVFRQSAATGAATRFNLVTAATHAQGGEGAGHFALASPVAAGGLPADALDLALVAALLQGVPADAPAAMAQALGGPFDADVVAERLRLRLPVWRRFGVV
jgi:SAM-dependent methyltransferase